jgi:hypothetical protein
MSSSVKNLSTFSQILKLMTNSLNSTGDSVLISLPIIMNLIPESKPILRDLDMLSPKETLSEETISSMLELELSV